MSRMAKIAGPVTGGVDTHADTHVAAVVDQVGRVLGTESFPADADGYAGLLAWLRGHGVLAGVGVEGTGSYGAGLARYLAAAGVPVLEVPRPDRQRRRRHGKSDAVDAVSRRCRAARGGLRHAQERRRGGRVDPGAAGGPGRRDQGPHPGRQPAPRPDHHRPRPAARPAVAGLSTPGGSAPPRRSPAAMPLTRPRAARRPWPASPAVAGPGHRDHPARSRAGTPGQAGRRTGVPRADRGGSLSVAALIAAAGGKPGRITQRGRVRRPVRRQHGRLLLRQAGTAPAQPRRGPASQLRAVADRRHPPAGSIFAPRTTTPAGSLRARPARKSSASSDATPPARPTASSSGPASSKPP